MRLSLLWVGVLLTPPLSAQNASIPKSYSGNPIQVEAIEVVGLNRTQRSVVDRELLYAPGATTIQADVDESMQRLRNLHIFATVEHRWLPGSQGQISQITVDERWTTIPIAKFNSGGGIQQYILGAYDINVMGRYIEMGGQFERLGETNSAVVWFRDPRFFGEKIYLGADIWDVRRTRTLYDPDVVAPEISGGYLLHRQRINFELGKEWPLGLGGHDVFASLVVDNHRDEFSTDYLSEEVADVQGDGPLPWPQNKTLVGPTLKLGRLDHNSFLVSGIRYEHKYRQTLGTSQEGDDEESLNTSSHEGELIGFATLPMASTAGIRAAFGLSDTKGMQDLFYIGGFDKIRGFEDSRFRGRNYWLVNAEYRIPSMRTRWFVIQHNVFYDVASVGNERDTFEKTTAGSTGVGIRFISPKIYRFIGRFDYAVPLKGEADVTPINFGVQQYF